MYFRAPSRLTHTSYALERLAVIFLYAELPKESRRFETLFHEFNGRYFSGHLPSFQVRVAVDVHRVSGEPFYFATDTRALFQRQSGRIYLRYSGRTKMEQSLIDEMAHVATDDDHGERWANEMARLKAAGAPVDDEDMDPYNCPKRHQITEIILYDAGQLRESRDEAPENDREDEA